MCSPRRNSLLAFMAISIGARSPIGEPLAMLPPTVPARAPVSSRTGAALRAISGSIEPSTGAARAKRNDGAESVTIRDFFD